MVPPPDLMRWRSSHRLRERELNVLGGKCGIQAVVAADHTEDSFAVASNVAFALFE
jgi:hypothetical protein